MANNTISIVDCATGKSVLIAKYYPSTGWYPVKTVAEKLLAFFESTDESPTDIATGAVDYELEFEQLTTTNKDLFCCRAFEAAAQKDARVTGQISLFTRADRGLWYILISLDMEPIRTPFRLIYCPFCGVRLATVYQSEESVPAFRPPA